MKTASARFAERCLGRGSEGAPRGLLEVALAWVRAQLLHLFTDLQVSWTFYMSFIHLLYRTYPAVDLNAHGHPYRWPP